MPIPNPSPRHKPGKREKKAIAQHYLCGLRAETIACWLLRIKGYRILAQRKRTPVGEIDILAEKGKTIAVVEVKYRPSLNQAAAAISPAQQKRLIRAGHYIWAQQKITSNRVLRFDAVLVNRWGWPEHLANAWSDNES